MYKKEIRLRWNGILVILNKSKITASSLLLPKHVKRPNWLKRLTFLSQKIRAHNWLFNDLLLIDNISISIRDSMHAPRSSPNTQGPNSQNNRCSDTVYFIRFHSFVNHVSSTYCFFKNTCTIVHIIRIKYF